VKLVEWARQQGISYKTAWRWVKDDAMPVPWRQLPSGTILVDAPVDERPSAVALYARVSNGKRRKLLRLLSDATIGAVVVEHRDRFARFGSEYLEAALAASGRRLIVVDSSEMNDDLVPDMIVVLTSFCARLYGRRSARNRAISIERALAREPQP
jgi:putative resolvase